MTQRDPGRRQRSRGFTLVEIIVVMAILSIVLMAVFSLIIPTQQAAVSQNRVADLQQGLRLALNVMTQDLLMAGFLVLDDPIVFEGNPTDPTGVGVPPPPSDPDDFTIRTRIVGSDFGRVTTEGVATVTLASATMAQNFPAGATVCLYEPLQATALTTSLSTVSAVSGSNITLGSGYTASNIPVETLVVRVHNIASCPTGADVQTIRYRINNGALERIINGNTQILARDIAGVNFGYEWTIASSPPQKVRRVDILLQGQTQALKNDSLSGAKERDVRTSVTLRNVF